MHTDMCPSKPGEVVPGQAAKLFLPFHVVYFCEQRCQQGAVNAQSAGQVGQAPAGTLVCGYEVRLISRRGFGRALLQRQAGGAEDAFGGRPRGDFGPEGLQSGYLGEGGGQVHAGQGAGMQGQGAHVVIGVLADEVEGLVGQEHEFQCF